MVNTLDTFYARQPEPNQSCLLALRDLILQQDSHIRSSLKWSMPCFSYKNRMFCFLMINKTTQSPYLLLVEGHQLDHPLLKTGSRKRMKVVDIEASKDLPLEAIEVILAQALELYRSGEIKTK